jgi:transposase
MVDAALTDLRPQLDAMCAKGGRPSIPPAKLLHALLLQLLLTVRSERRLMEQFDYIVIHGKRNSMNARKFSATC